MTQLSTVVVTQAELDALPETEDSSYDQTSLAKCKSDLCDSGWIIVGHPNIKGGVGVVEIESDKDIAARKKANDTEALLAEAKALQGQTGTFKVNEEIYLKGHKFIVASVKRNRLILKTVRPNVSGKPNNRRSRR